MEKKMLVILSITGAMAVSIGAFGAHGLKSLVTPEKLEIFKTGVSYHFYHVLAMMGALALYLHTSDTRFRRAFYLFLIGVVLFSGSLYGLAVREVVSIPLTWLGPITPIGGLFFIAGWLSLIIGKNKK